MIRSVIKPAIGNAIRPIVGIPGDPGISDPVPDYEFKYQLDGYDAALTWHSNGGTPAIIQGFNTRLGPECNEAKSTMFVRSLMEYYDSSDNAKVAAGNGAWSLGFWIKTVNASEVLVIAGNGSGTGDTWRIEATDTGLIRWRSDSINRTASGFPINDGDWHHVVMVNDGASIIGGTRYYIDGALAVTLDSSAYNMVDTGDLVVGARPGEVNPFDGNLDGLVWYNRALTPAEVTARYDYRCDFIPSQVATLSWLDASRVGTITEAAGFASQIDDLSGASNNIIQPTGAKQLSTGSRTFNNMNTLESAATSQNMYSTNTISGVSGGNLAIVSVHDLDTVATGLSTAAIIGMTGDVDFGLRSNDPNQFSGRLSFAGQGDVAINSGPYSGGFLSSIMLDGDESSKMIRILGTLEPSSNAYSPVISTNQVFHLFRGRQEVGYPSAFGESVLVSDLSLVEKLEGYIAWKWGLVPQLDASNPYKTVPPKEEVI